MAQQTKDAVRKCRKGRGLSYAEFEFGFVIAAAGIALTVGFGYAAVLSAMMGFELSMGNWWLAALQAHGHALLMGWAGLFIVGVSVYFVPRLAGVPLRAPNLLPWTLASLASGILLRSLAQPLLNSPVPDPVRYALRWGLGLSGIAEATGVALYLFLLVGTACRAARDRVSFRSVRIFLLMSVCGWTLYTAIGSVLCVVAAAKGDALVHIAWNRFGIALFIGLVLVPVAMAFSIRTLPLYLRLPAIDWAPQRLGLLYLCSLVLEQLPTLVELLGLFSEQRTVLHIVSSAGQVLKGATLLFFIWRLDLLSRRRPPGTVNRRTELGIDRRPTRPGLPDYGEFGRFEWLLYGAYVSLALCAVLELMAGTAALGGLPSVADPDAIRHTYLAGFISLLLFGMAPRVIPGFLHKRQVARPGLVVATFWIAGTSGLFRVAPLLMANSLDYIPYGLQISMWAFGLSGLLGWIAAAILGYNLWATWRR